MFDECFCSSWKDMKLNESHLRLVVMTENEKRLLYDSETVLPNNSGCSVPPNSQLSKCQRFHVSTFFFSLAAAYINLLVSPEKKKTLVFLHSFLFRLTCCFCCSYICRPKVESWNSLLI